MEYNYIMGLFVGWIFGALVGFSYGNFKATKRFDKQLNRINKKLSSN